MPLYYYAVAGLLVLVLLLLLMRAQKAKAAKVVPPMDIHAGWLPTSAATATPDAWAPAAPESKRQARARARTEAKAASKAAAEAKSEAKAQAKAEAKAAKSGIPIPVGETESPVATGKARRHRRTKQAGVDTQAAPLAPANAAPALINQDGWLTTSDEGAPAAAAATQPVHEVRDLFEPQATAYSVPPQHAPQQVPLQPPHPQQAAHQQAPPAGAHDYAMAGAPAQFTHAAAAPQGPVAPPSSSFTELLTAPPAQSAPTAPPAPAPELPTGPYTFGARTILPGK